MKNFTILTFAKIMAFIIVMVATSGFYVAMATQALPDLSWEGIKSSILEWVIGLFLASLTLIVGYVANLVRYAIGYIYDLIRAYIANTQILEVLADLKDFCLKETDTVEVLANKALENDNKIDDKELNEIVQKVVSDAIAVWGEKKVTYLTKYRPMLKEWLTVKAKAMIRDMIDRFRARKSESTVAVTDAVK